MNSLKNIQLVNQTQVNFGKRLGLDLDGKSLGVARAEIDDAITRDFYGFSYLGRPSEKQCALALKFGIDISAMSKAVGAAYIDDIMYQLNMDAISKHNLAPGVPVRHTTQPNENLVISSIAPDGTVYFKGGNGKRAWARSLVRT
jgi:hypothetical protein